jgi:hypothetical protein
MTTPSRRLEQQLHLFPSSSRQLLPFLVFLRPLWCHYGASLSAPGPLVEDVVNDDSATVDNVIAIDEYHDPPPLTPTKPDVPRSDFPQLTPQLLEPRTAPPDPAPLPTRPQPAMVVPVDDSVASLLQSMEARQFSQVELDGTRQWRVRNSGG